MKEHMKEHHGIYRTQNNDEDEEAALSFTDIHDWVNKCTIFSIRNDEANSDTFTRCMSRSFQEGTLLTFMIINPCSTKEERMYALVDATINPTMYLTHEQDGDMYSTTPYPQ